MKSKGVPKGYREHWSYRGHWDETKVAPKTWKVEFNATKRRRARMGGLQRGTTIVWAINGKRYARKDGAGHYQTKLIATKS